MEVMGEFENAGVYNTIMVIMTCLVHIFLVHTKRYVLNNIYANTAINLTTICGKDL